MQDPKKEFTLIDTSSGKWNVHEVHSEKFTHEKKVRQPGEPLHSSFKLKNIFEEQTAHFILTSVDADISDIVLELDNYKEIQFPVNLKKGQTIKYSGGSEAHVFDINWQKISELKVNEADLKISTGEHELNLDCKFNNVGEKPLVRLEIRTIGKGEALIPEG